MVIVSRFRIEAMDCTAEEQLVRMRLSGLDGVDLVRVDLDSREVAVRHRTDAAAVDSALRSLDLGTTYLGDGGDVEIPADTGRERSALRIALAINAAFFVGELTVGLVSRSMGLVADALDMGADASVYALSLAAVGTSAARKNRLARVSGYLQLGLALLGMVEVIRRLVGDEDLPDVTSMIVVSLLVLAGNIVTLVILRRVRSDDAHFQASWIFTANDIKVNALVILAACGVAWFDSALPDLVAGIVIFGVVANGARRILKLAG
ncbi:MAG: cation transporter [Acidimicrobiales bacterium]|nr:cation transporter [Acidimicrobiales bacterium]